MGYRECYRIDHREILVRLSNDSTFPRMHVVCLDIPTNFEVENWYREDTFVVNLCQITFEWVPHIKLDCLQQLSSNRGYCVKSKTVLCATKDLWKQLALKLTQISTRGSTNQMPFQRKEVIHPIRSNAMECIFDNDIWLWDFFYMAQLQK